MTEPGAEIAIPFVKGLRVQLKKVTADMDPAPVKRAHAKAVDSPDPAVNIDIPTVEKVPKNVTKAVPAIDKTSLAHWSSL